MYAEPCACPWLTSLGSQSQSTGTLSSCMCQGRHCDIQDDYWSHSNGLRVTFMRIEQTAGDSFQHDRRQGGRQESSSGSNWHHAHASRLTFCQSEHKHTCSSTTYCPRAMSMPRLYPRISCTLSLMTGTTWPLLCRAASTLQSDTQARPM